MPNNNQFYPSISEILPLDGIPESLKIIIKYSNHDAYPYL